LDRAVSSYYEAGGFLWPANVGKWRKYGNHAHELAAVLPFLRRQRVAVQAGGHCGMYPIWLAKQFERVYTFEPEARNFACLLHNVRTAGVEGSVYAARGLLCHERRPLHLSVHGKNSGGHKVVELGTGPVPCYRIDDMALEHVDLIQLDVEFMELPALMGAVDTIERCRPVLMLEAKDFGNAGVWGNRGDLMCFLKDMRYEVKTWLKRDAILTSSQ
jgi:FkbM family methyltransferase